MRIGPFLIAFGRRAWEYERADMLEFIRTLNEPHTICVEWSGPERFRLSMKHGADWEAFKRWVQGYYPVEENGGDDDRV